MSNTVKVRSRFIANDTAISFAYIEWPWNKFAIPRGAAESLIDTAKVGHDAEHGCDLYDADKVDAFMMDLIRNKRFW